LVWLSLWIPQKVKVPQIEYPKTDGLIIVQRNSVMVVSNPNLPLKTSVLAGLTDEEDIIFLIKGKYPEMAKIIQCESSWREKICSYKGCYAGMGYAQIIPSTLQYCEKKLNRKLDAFDGFDNLNCALWLYLNEGNYHWNSSKNCWD